jgi:hypothetical protein
MSKPSVNKNSKAKIPFRVLATKTPSTPNTEQRRPLELKRVPDEEIEAMRNKAYKYLIK